MMEGKEMQQAQLVEHVEKQQKFFHWHQQLSRQDWE